MNNSKRKNKSLLIIAALIILIGGCIKTNNKDSYSVKTFNNKNSEGLLIGLLEEEVITDSHPRKNEESRYRTFWIHKENNSITYIEKKGEIIAPYKDSFYKLGNGCFFEWDPCDNAKSPSNIYGNLCFYYTLVNIVSHPADKPMEKLYTKETLKKKYLNPEKVYTMDSYKSQVEWLWYVGNNYACVMEYNHEIDGGTQSINYDFKMYDIGNLSSLNGRNKTLALADLLDANEKVKLQEYPEKYNRVLSSYGNVKIEQIADIKNLMLSRKGGKWQVLIPLYRVSENSGNGSSERYVKEYIDTDIKLPKAITSFDNLCVPWDTIKQKIPEAKDAVSSPNNDVLAVLTPTKLLVFSNPKSGIDKPALSIDVDEYESIILNQWSTGELADKWNREIKKYK